MKIDRLGKSHVQMLNIMWSLKTQEAYDEWLENLHPTQRQLAHSLGLLVAYELLEEELNTDTRWIEKAKQEIKRCQSY
jgi:hypothetical protein